MEGSSSNKDTRRVLQVFLPGVPAPYLDLIQNTVFASINTSTQRGGARGTSSGKYRLRRMDSGPLGQYGNLITPTGSVDKKFCDVSQFQFDYKLDQRKH